MDVNKNVSKVHMSDRTKRELSRIYRVRDFYYIKDGDFDIVWTNVSIFVFGHLLYFWGLYTLWNEWLITTWIYSEYSPQLEDGPLIGSLSTQLFSSCTSSEQVSEQVHTVSGLTSLTMHPSHSKSISCLVTHSLVM